jgi:cardiolipin synthase A/B
MTALDRHVEHSASDALWSAVPRPVFSGGNQLQLLHGGDMLFPAMVQAIERATSEIWLATYIFNNDPASDAVAQALAEAALRGVKVRVVVDGFGSKASLPQLSSALIPAGVQFTIFRPLKRWWNWLQPGQLRRLHQKLCVVDGRVGFVGGINMLDDRLDLHHGWTDSPRLDFAVQLSGPAVQAVEQTISAVWTRAQLGRHLKQEVSLIAREAQPLANAKRLIRRLRMTQNQSALASSHAFIASEMQPMHAAFVLRDNFRQRRTIERSYIDAIRRSRTRVDLISAYFYPGREFRHALVEAAERGVRVRLLLQGKLDYRMAGLAARALYDELLSHGVRIYEYTPAFLHAKVGVVDDDWATVGSSNIDPLSLLLNLEANMVVRDKNFASELAAQFDTAVAASTEIDPSQTYRPGVLGALRRGLVAWCAHVYLRLAGATGKY